MSDNDEKDKKLTRRDALGLAIAGAGGALLSSRGHGQMIPFAFQQKKAAPSFLATIPGTQQTHGSADATSSSYYLLIDNVNSRVIFTTGNRVNASSQLYTLPRYLQASSSISVTLGMTVASGTVYACGGGGGGGGSTTYACGHGGASGRYMVATMAFTQSETLTLDCGIKTPPVSSVGNSSPYYSRAYFSASKFVQAGGGGSHDYSGAPTPSGSSSGTISLTTDTYHFGPSGNGSCNDAYYYTQSSPSGSGHSFMGAVFGTPGTYFRNAGVDGFVCLQFA